MMWTSKDLLRIGGTALLFALLPALLPRIGSSIPVGTEIMIWGIFATGYNILLGGTGILSFGHARSSACRDTHGAALLKANLPLSAAIPAAVAMSLLAAFLIGALIIRKRGIYFAMLTIAFGQMFYFIASQWNSVTGGQDGLTASSALSFSGSTFPPEVNFFYFVFVFFVLTLLLVRALMNSSIGKTCGDPGEHPPGGVPGIDVKKYQHFAFVVSATFSGWRDRSTCCSQFRFPELLNWKTSGDAVLMSVIGGMRAFFGPLVGRRLRIPARHDQHADPPLGAAAGGDLRHLRALLPEGDPRILREGKEG